MFCNRRNTNRCVIVTQGNTHINKVAGRKRKESAIFNEKIKI
jgi:hypothetical protein